MPCFQPENDHRLQSLQQILLFSAKICNIVRKVKAKTASIQVDQSVHGKFRSYCREHGVSISFAAGMALSEYVSSRRYGMVALLTPHSTLKIDREIFVKLQRSARRAKRTTAGRAEDLIRDGPEQERLMNAPIGEMPVIPPHPELPLEGTV